MEAKTDIRMTESCCECNRLLATVIWNWPIFPRKVLGMTRTFTSAVIAGCVYSTVLCLIGVVVAGFGHGSYTLLGLAGAPFSFLGIPIAIIATLCQWSFLAAAWQKIRFPKPYFISFLALHYIAATALLLLPSSQFADWEYVGHLPRSYQFLLACGFFWYLIGQVLIWRVLSRPRLP